MRMVEKVARAVYEKRNGAGCRPWSILTKSGKTPYLDDARAAIKAMREPTDEMVKAGVEFALSATVSGDGGWPRYVAEKHRAMIDKAIQESGE